MERVGLVEKVKIIGRKGTVATLAKFDTGASNNSIDYKIAAETGAGPVVSSIRMHSASVKTYTRRPVVEVKIGIKGRVFDTKANLTDRRKMKYKVLIGRGILLKNFIVDISKSHKGVSDYADIKDSVIKEAGLKIGEIKFLKTRKNVSKTKKNTLKTRKRLYYD